VVKELVTYHAYNENSLMISWPETLEMISKRTIAVGGISKIFKDQVTINPWRLFHFNLWKAINHKSVIALMDKNSKLTNF
jgi:hypothetical protein